MNGSRPQQHPGGADFERVRSAGRLFGPRNEGRTAGSAGARAGSDDGCAARGTRAGLPGGADTAAESVVDRDLPASIAAAAAVLGGAGVASPRHDAEALAAHLLGIPRSGLVLAGPLTGEQQARYAELIDLRAARVPLQHLTGVAGFRRLELAVGPGVFVPRPETEVLAGWAVAALTARSAAADPLVVDLCAGSGAVALALAQEVRGARVHAVEREPHALAWARRNVAARAAAGDPPVTLHAADVADPSLLADLTGAVDLVTANPPYIPAGATVEPEVAQHDPPAALWGGPDGLAVVRAVEAAAARLLRPGGLVGVEHADVQGESVPALFVRTGRWADVTDHPDLAGRPRYTTARRH
jgi:release factor glutamine methyltransferase